MKPAFSVIFFTVSSGAGLGLAIWLVLARWLGAALEPRGFWAGVVISAVLITLGLLSSTLHLANRKNAWRAFSRFRSSWLSREGVLAVLIYPVAAAYLYAIHAGSVMLELTAGIALVMLAFAVLLCTAMIYACLKTVPRWRNGYTVAAYPLFGLASGGVLWLAVRARFAAAAQAVAQGAGAAAEGAAGAGAAGANAAEHTLAAAGQDPAAVLAVLLLVAGGLLKLRYWRSFSDDGEAGLSAARALNLRGHVRLLDVGHTHANFLTDEFGFVFAREQARLMRFLALALAFGVPIVLLMAGAAGSTAAICCLLGLLCERWLFFAEARHVVRLYHGQTRI